MGEGALVAPRFALLPHPPRRALSGAQCPLPWPWHPHLRARRAARLWPSESLPCGTGACAFCPSPGAPPRAGVLTLGCACAATTRQVPANVKEQTTTKHASVEVEVASLSAALATFKELKAAGN